MTGLKQLDAVLEDIPEDILENLPEVEKTVELVGIDGEYGAEWCKCLPVCDKYKGCSCNRQCSEYYCYY